MRFRLRSPSLFVTFAVAFLAVLLLAIVLQGLLVVWLLNPLVERWEVTRAELSARNAAQEIGIGWEGLDDAGVSDILQREAARVEDLGLFYAGDDGHVLASVEGPRELMGRFRDRSHRSPMGPAPEPAMSSRFVEMLEGSDRVRLLHREPVLHGGERKGEVLAILPRWPRRTLPRGGARTAVFFLPLAVLVAGVGGLGLFRVLVGRLRSLEELATRVSEGDLEARISDPGRDEIGRLASRLNAMTARLAEAREQLEANDRQRRRFLADITHELATPLTTIRGTTETLLDPGIERSPSERIGHLRNALEETERMDRLIQELLELSRLESGAVPFHREPLDLVALCRNTLERLRPRFTAAGLQLDWAGTLEEAWLEADGQQLERVLDNLLGNALRHVPSGCSVQVSVDTADGDAVLLRVADDGNGFPTESLPHVFDRFYRADPSRAGQGTGLGLSIVREIVERHGGRVWATNQRSRGAVLHVRLPRSS